MKKGFALIALLLCFGLAATEVHKFYVAIFQINYASEKKMLQITSRIFIDDLNEALNRKYHTRTHLGEPEESPEDIALLKKYLSEKMLIKVNGQPKIADFRSSETENNVYICYLSIRDVAKITTLDITNKVLFDYVTDQQNIIQTNVNGRKDNLLLTVENAQGTLKY